MNSSGIYEILNTVDGKRYVGSAVNLSGRFAVHRSALMAGKHGNRHLQNAWNLRGGDAFSFRPMLICHKRDLLFYEQRMLDATRPEYNLSPTAGNSLGVKWSDDAKLALASRGLHNKHFIGRRHTPETLLRMSLAHMGKPGTTKGRKRNPDAVAKTAAAHRGMKRSMETRLRISASRTGKRMAPRSPEYRAKMSAALKGRSTLSLEARARMAFTKRGQKLSEEHKAKIGAASRAAWAMRKRKLTVVESVFTC